MTWKNFFYLSHGERHSILLLLVFAAGIFLGKFLSFSEKEPFEEPEPVEKTASRVDLPETPKPEIRKKQYAPPPKKEQRTYYVQKKDTAKPPARDYPKTPKLSKGETLELNTADTLDLKKIPGIGSAYACRISGYRQRLGGYLRLEQLQEVEGMYEELYAKIVPYLTVNPNETVRLPVNTASLEKLKKHPYLNFYQAKAIIEIRKKKGRLDGIDDLKLLEEFTGEDWMLLEPYLEF
ncbi:MAG: helix-hairpin-helix domain-containing protein [Dysgonamonadaceae bacterium]|jgi:DNA uptake protein ComE-like DNA-binding protein|nr:helix-hairpin-helix domain-containing protein [Dysgonamonadaceae bacterium]